MLVCSSHMDKNAMYGLITLIENDPKCVLIDTNKDKTISNSVIKSVRFKNDLTSNEGTILFVLKTVIKM